MIKSHSLSRPSTLPSLLLPLNLDATEFLNANSCEKASLLQIEIEVQTAKRRQGDLGVLEKVGLALKGTLLGVAGHVKR